MRKVTLFMHMSLDGKIAQPDGEMDWAEMNDKEMTKYMFAHIYSNIDTMLLGRVVYQVFESYWPAQAKDPATRPELVELANWIEDTPKIVFSKTLNNVEWKNSTIVNGDIAAEISRLKQQPGKDMVVFGGASFAATLAQNGLIDEYQLILDRVILGEGKALFDGVKEKVDLNLVESRTFKSGVVCLFYQPNTR